MGTRVEIYDRLSPAMQTFLVRLTVTHDTQCFSEEAERLDNPIRKYVKGYLLNTVDGLTATQPVIHTNLK
jgi:hypothetical protein